jgi:hypothetical protein
MRALWKHVRGIGAKSATVSPNAEEAGTTDKNTPGETKQASTSVTTKVFWKEAKVKEGGGDEEGGNQVPLGRYGHSLVVVPSKHSLLSFGGSNRVEFSSELFEYDLNNKTWRLLSQGPDEENDAPTTTTTASSSSSSSTSSSSSSSNVAHPSKRHFHTACLLGDCMIVFGGKSNKYHNDVWAYHIGDNKWTEVTPTSGRRPSKRYGHTAVVYQNSIWIFGGFDNDSMACNDLWKLSAEEDGGGFTWTKIDTETRPGSRYHHSAVVSGRAMLVFAGLGDAAPLNDLWAFSFENMEWHEVKTEAGPCPRFAHAALVFASSNKRPNGKKQKK